MPPDMGTREPDPDLLRSAGIIAGDDDPCCTGGAADVYAARQGVDIDLVPGAGHLDVTAGYRPWPSALGRCLDPSTRMVGR